MLLDMECGRTGNAIMQREVLMILADSYLGVMLQSGFWLQNAKLYDKVLSQVTRSSRRKIRKLIFNFLQSPSDIRIS